MKISYSEQLQLTCPHCNADFSAEVWLIVDAQEHPDAATALLSGQLNLVACPYCGRGGPAGAPLLYHDGAARTVIFAAAPGAAEHQWREQARDLHALLVGSIPEEQRRSYLGDVQIAQDVEGIAHILRKTARRTARGQTAGAEEPRSQGDRETGRPETRESSQADRDASRSPAAYAQPPDEEYPPLLLAVQRLLAADTPAELQHVLDHHPVLLAPDTDLALAQLADVAAAQREHEIAESLRRARQLLARMQAAAGSGAGETAGAPAAGELPDEIYRALIQARSTEDLHAAMRSYPQLVEPWVDQALAARVDEALADEDERLARLIEERREALAGLRAPGGPARSAGTERAAGSSQPPLTPPADDLEEAIEALLIAEDEEAMARVINDYPVLLTDAAQQALWQFASEARASGDDDMATYAVECRAMLRQVRDGLAE